MSTPEFGQGRRPFIPPLDRLTEPFRKAEKAQIQDAIRAQGRDGSALDGFDPYEIFDLRTAINLLRFEAQIGGRTLKAAEVHSSIKEVAGSKLDAAAGPERAEFEHYLALVDAIFGALPDGTLPPDASFPFPMS